MGRQAAGQVRAATRTPRLMVKEGTTGACFLAPTKEFRITLSAAVPMHMVLPQHHLLVTGVASQRIPGGPVPQHFQGQALCARKLAAGLPQHRLACICRGSDSRRMLLFVASVSTAWVYTNAERPQSLTGLPYRTGFPGNRYLGSTTTTARPQSTDAGPVTTVLLCLPLLALVG